MTTLAIPRRRAGVFDKRFGAGLVFVLMGLVDAFVFGLFSGKGDAVFELSLAESKFHVPPLTVAPTPVCMAAGAISVAIGIAYALRPFGKAARRVAMSAVILAFIVAVLCWSDAGAGGVVVAAGALPNRIPLPLVALLQNTLASSIPLILGALAGCMCERSGVINIAIEGQLLLGAFTGAVVASVTTNIWIGLVTAPFAGALLGVLLAVFAIRYLVDQIILGVVLNVFASGLTGYLYDRLLVPYQNTLNSPSTFSFIKIPVLGDIPIIGPILFDSTIFLYLTYAALALVQIGLFSTRWGLRVRAVGEHPTAADTVGIRVLFTRYRNVILGGLLAGLGGAYLTIGSVGSFGKDISSGQGYIALAALIFGRWTPLGALGAALLFGFATALENVLGTIGSPIPSDVLLMLPYLATIVAVAGLVGRVRAPAADGQPYVKA